MKIIKKNKVLLSLILIPYIYLLIICTVRTDTRGLLTGDITPVDSLIELENSYEEKGSFNTVYVISYDFCTIFQNRLLETSEINTSTSVSQAYDYMTTQEVNLMSKLQHQSSVQAAIITAYKAAMQIEDNVKLDYKLSGAYISYYSNKVTDLKIGDKIVGVNGIYAKDDSEAFRTAFNEKKFGDIFNISRNGTLIEVTYSENHYGQYSIYADYDIDYDNAIPKITVNKTNTGGPSGGLLQTLEVFNRLVSTDYSLGKTIAGTGTINMDGTVGGIGAVEQKIHTAYKRGVDIFFCPEVNYEDALKAYNTLPNKERMALVKVNTFSDAIEYLQNEM